MQRAGSLIKRLLEQYETNSGADTLIITTQMLLTELQQHTIPQNNTGKKVAVIMPAVSHSVTGLQQPLDIANEATVAPLKEIPVKIEQEMIIEPVKKEYAIKPPAHSNIHLFDDLPTFAYQQKEVFELNDSMAEHKESLNESLKADKTELGSILKDAPIRDLRRAIGINDRFVFINELFRGDEDMYERSIKTINSFNIHPEAEYWIKRELKLKQAWDESSPVVQLFDQLVRRRFS